jgi:AmmeMemoRadiSam system protein B
LKVRRPAQAGSFYAGTAESLNAQITQCFTHTLGPGRTPTVEDGLRRIVGLICPHAGYMYSGPVAAHSYYHLAIDGKPDTVVILGPNHTGVGSGLALASEGAWRTPLGDVQVDEATAREILRRSKILDFSISTVPPSSLCRSASSCKISNLAARSATPWPRRCRGETV